MIVDALHRAKLEPPGLSADSIALLEAWLQSAIIYRSSLNLTDVQILKELQNCHTKEPGKSFKHSAYCQMDTILLAFQKGVFAIWQPRLGPDWPSWLCPSTWWSFFAKMLKLKKVKEPIIKAETNWTDVQAFTEEIQSCTPNSSVIDLLLRAHKLPVVLEPDGRHNVPMHYGKHQNSESHCFKCSLPDFISRTGPRFSQVT